MDDLLQIKRTEIIAGMNKEYVFFQISDIHMAVVDTESSQLDISDNIRFHKQWDSLKYKFADDAKEFCDERYDIEANELFEKLAEYALEINSDALILSGDIMDRVTESNLRYLKQFIKNYPIPVIYCLGNHGYINEFGEHLNQYSRFFGLIDNPSFDSYDIGELEIVTVDNGTKAITDEQITNLKNKFAKCKKKILLVLHAPLNMGDFAKAMKGKISPYFLQGVEGDCKNAFLFNKVVEENSEKLVAVLAGHVHFFSEHRITEKTMQYTTSSGLIGAGRHIIIK